MKKLYVILMVVLVMLVVAGVAVAGGDSGAPRVTTLSGAEEVNNQGVPNQGDPDGSGFASITLNVGQRRVCWKITFQNIATPFAAHIHAAPVGINGPIVVPLDPIASGCTNADPDLIKAIIKNPELYYVNVHNADFPGGALRGQLSNRGQSQ